LYNRSNSRRNGQGCRDSRVNMLGLGLGIFESNKFIQRWAMVLGYTARTTTAGLRGGQGKLVIGHGPWSAHVHPKMMMA
jgi:hypothetical protein